MASVSAGGRLAGRIVVIIGVAGGQGRAAAPLFAREGATVVGEGPPAGSRPKSTS